MLRAYCRVQDGHVRVAYSPDWRQYCLFAEGIIMLLEKRVEILVYLITVTQASNSLSISNPKHQGYSNEAESRGKKPSHVLTLI